MTASAFGAPTTRVRQRTVDNDEEFADELIEPKVLPNSRPRMAENKPIEPRG